MSQDFASIVIIKRTGTDGPRFPLRRNECLFGRFVSVTSEYFAVFFWCSFIVYVLGMTNLYFDRDTTCDLRIQLPGVALEHAKVSSSENQNVSYSLFASAEDICRSSWRVFTMLILHCFSSRTLICWI